VPGGELRTHRCPPGYWGGFLPEADGDGLCPFAKRLEHGLATNRQRNGFADAGALFMLLEGIDWCRSVRTSAPQMAV
jgi:hypothetical protein